VRCSKGRKSSALRAPLSCRSRKMPANPAKGWWRLKKFETA
jgi:hypothetical protein